MRLLVFPSHGRLILTLALLLLTVPVSARDTTWGRGILQGITELGVVIEAVDPGAKRDGLERSQVYTQIALRLRRSGIQVVPLSSTAPFLYVRINTRKVEDRPVCSYVVRADLISRQGVPLIRDPASTSAGSIWSHTAFGVRGTARVSALQADVSDAIDQFVKTYLAQNPTQ